MSYQIRHYVGLGVSYEHVDDSSDDIYLITDEKGLTRGHILPPPYSFSHVFLSAIKSSRTDNAFMECKRYFEEVIENLRQYGDSQYLEKWLESMKD